MKTFINTKLKWIVMIALGIMMTGFMTGCSLTSINLNEYFECSITGYDGHAKVESSFDGRRLEEDLIKKMNLSDYDGGVYLKTAEIIDCIKTGEWSKTEGISNGDEVVYTWNVDTERMEKLAGIGFTCKEVKLTAKDLEQIEEVDVFKDVEITSDGIAPNGSLIVTSKAYPNLAFTVENNGYLNVGDKTNISIDWSEEAFIEEYNAVPAQMSMEYTVEKLDAYMTRCDQITDELDKQIKKELDDYVIQYEADHPKVAVKDYKALGYYLLTAKDTKNVYLYNHNILYCVFKIKLHNQDPKEDVTAYRYLKFVDPMVLHDGTAYVDLTSYDYPGENFFRDYDDFKTKLQTTYVGYKDLDSLHNALVNANKIDYECDSTVKE